MTDINWRARAEAAETSLLAEKTRFSMMNTACGSQIQRADHAEEALEKCQEAYTELNRELAAAREDSARLEWMIEKLSCHSIGLRSVALLRIRNEWKITSENQQQGHISTNWHPTPRAAIDEARKK